MRLAAAAAAVLLTIAGGGCARLGYTDRVLRISPPDGQLVAVCQEVPVFNGPEFEVRLERSDGRLVQIDLLEDVKIRAGKSDPCKSVEIRVS